MNKKTVVQPLSENTRKAIIIAAIVVVAVIILSISLALILKPAALSSDEQQTPSGSYSSLKIMNGDFAYTESEDTAFPKTAQNWTRYGYKAKNGSTHSFDSISSNTEQFTMGIVDLSEDNWPTVEEDLKAEGLTVNNPGLHENDDDEEKLGDGNDNVYMIAAKELTAVSILSDSFSVSSGASVKISIWLNTAQLKDNSEAVVMVQKSTISAKNTYWYAYDFHIAKADGWQKFDFYIFNREASQQYVRLSIGVGNVYSGEDGLELVGETNEPIKGEGVLFIDDITYETVTANDYREVVDADDAKDSTRFKVLENEDIVEESRYLTLETVDGAAEKELVPFTDAYDFAKAAGGYSPFTNRDDFYKDNNEGEHTETTGFTIYKLNHDGSPIDEALALRLDASDLNKGASKNINVKSSLLLKDHHHISFWVRVDQNNKAAYANVFVQKWNTEKNAWEDANTSSNWKIITTSQDIDEDANCGWVKYDVYLKPSANEEQISILFVFGNRNGYSDEEKELGIIPDGDMYVTSPAYEKISYSDYNNATSGSYVKKVDLVGTSATTTIANGSFSSVDSTGVQPANWAPAFAGDNSLYKDGKGNLGGLTDEQRLASVIADSGVVQNFAFPVIHKDKTPLDDEQNSVLQINNKVATSFGYYSTDFTLSARTAYVVSVMFRTDSGLSPYIYLINAATKDDDGNALSREDRILTSVPSKDGSEQKSNEIKARLFGADYDNTEIDNGWVRYFMVVVTDDQSLTVRLALFNGSIDGEQQTTGSVYYDKVELLTLGTYSNVENEDAEEGSEEAKYYKEQWTDHAFLTGTSGNTELYGENFGELLDTEENNWLTEWGISVHQPTSEKRLEMRLIPDEDEEETTTTDDETTTETSDIDWGLLFSVISSVALVAALLVVFVIKVYKNRGRMRKAA